MEGIDGGGAASLVPPRRATRGTAVAAALATFWVSAALGFVAARRWKRAVFWELTDWAWIGVGIAGALSGHPRLMWAGFFACIAWRIPAAVDAYRVVSRAADPMGWGTLVCVWCGLALFAFVMARGVIRPFFLEAFQIPATSMYPTLLVGDHIFVDKRRRVPQRGDVIVFQYPIEPSTAYIKRVIGLPGDIIEISAGALVVNGAPVSRARFQEDCGKGADGFTAYEESIPCVLWHETLDGRTYEIGTDTDLGERRDFFRSVVPENAVFVLGDNRDNSSDSRVWGAVPLQNIKGVARLVWWSRAPAAGSQSSPGVRWDRVNALVR